MDEFFYKINQLLKIILVNITKKNQEEFNYNFY